jgi:hypothetical protein
MAIAAVVVAFVLAEESSLRGRARAVVRAWARSATETTTVELRSDGTTIACTTTEQTACHLLFSVIHEEDL